MSPVRNSVADAMRSFRIAKPRPHRLGKPTGNLTEIGLIREFVWLRKRFKQLTRLMSRRSAIMMMAQRAAPTVDVLLAATSSVCRIRPYSSDLACLEKVFFDEEYRLPFSSVPKNIVDAGANIGAASLYFAKKFPDARIIALEPEDSNFVLLKQNCKHLPNVVPIQAALWSVAQQLTFTDAESEKWAFSVQPSFGQGAIRGVTVNELMEEFGIDQIDLLKLDIEGAEKEIFERGASEWLDRVSIIAIELHDRYKPGCSQAFYSALQGQQFAQEVCGENVFIRLMHGS